VTAALAIALLLASAGPGPTTAWAGQGSRLRFVDVTREAGLKFRHNFGARKLENVLMTTGSGCALVDFDGDGWLDAFLVNGTFLDTDAAPRTDKVTRHALFRNRGDGTFEDVTRAAGFGVPSFGQGVTAGDFDGDGHTDLYLTNYGPNRLYRNTGSGTFEDVTKRARVGDPRWSTGAVFFDQDGDGDLDLFVANYVDFKPGETSVHASALSKRMGFRFFPGPRDYDAQDDVLYRNDGDGIFTDVSEKVGLLSGGKGLNSVAGDFDDDGDQDLFVANDATPNFLYRNDEGKFTNVALTAGVAYDPDGTETAAMGVDVADVNEDGRQDLFVTNMVFEFNNMYVNEGKLQFTDLTKTLGLHKDNFRHVGWATRFVDFDHDGHLDCFVANGHVVDYVEGLSQSITYGQRNMLFLGDDQGRFKDVANRIGEPFARKRVSRGAAVADYDNDGDVDILVLNSGSRAELLRNDLPENDRWMKIRLVGRAPNRHAIGAKVVLHVGARTLHSEVRFASTYLSSSDPTLHFGLESGIETGTVDIRWPLGHRSSHEVHAGRLTTIPEPGSEPATESTR